MGGRGSWSPPLGTRQEAAALVSGVTLDAGALIAIDRAERRIALLLAYARSQGERVTIPATALAQVLRSPVRQVRLLKLCRQRDTDLIALDGSDATAVGLILANTRTSDIVDAHVVVCARRAQQAVLTSDPDDISRLAPDVITIKV
jgi:hypothetical protein